ncbi:MAG TPA: hypothetical protein VK611_16775 [Acidimicrobiales bacterium]|nr:hypothetical protein [Acidimicrobiales bacterium]
MTTTPAHARTDDRGQATTEYGLVLLVAGTLALALIVWARETGALTDLFDRVLDSLTGAI